MSESKSRMVFGYQPVRELLRQRPHDVEELWIGAGRRGKRRDEIEELAERHRVRVRSVSRAQLSLRAGAEEAVHNGFLATARIGERMPKRGDPELVVLLEDIQDPRNLGALLRVCDGAGVGKVLIRDRGSAPLSPTVTKSAAGAVEGLAIDRVTNSARELGRLKKEGFWIYGSDADGDAPWRYELTGPVVFCFGGEYRGLRARTRSCCDVLLWLPMRGEVASLNVATAASALLYEAVRQRSG